MGEETQESAFMPAEESKEPRVNRDPNNPQRSVDPRDPSYNPEVEEKDDGEENVG